MHCNLFQFFHLIFPPLPTPSQFPPLPTPTFGQVRVAGGKKAGCPSPNIGQLHVTCAFNKCLNAFNKCLNAALDDCSRLFQLFQYI